MRLIFTTNYTSSICKVYVQLSLEKKIAIKSVLSARLLFNCTSSRFRRRLCKFMVESTRVASRTCLNRRNSKKAFFKRINRSIQNNFNQPPDVVHQRGPTYQVECAISLLKNNLPPTKIISFLLLHLNTFHCLGFDVFSSRICIKNGSPQIVVFFFSSFLSHTLHMN